MSSQIARQTEGAFFKAPREFGKRTPNGFPIAMRQIERAKQNRELNKLKITHCEIRLSGCLGNKYLSWAHYAKSRFLLTDKGWLVCAAINRRTP